MGKVTLKITNKIAGGLTLVLITLFATLIFAMRSQNKTLMTGFLLLGLLIVLFKLVMSMKGRFNAKLSKKEKL